jgi:hypothetical protein
MQQMQDAAAANSLDLRVRKATTWEVLKEKILPGKQILQIATTGTYEGRAGEATTVAFEVGGIITLRRGIDLAANPAIVPHEFMHGMGLHHNQYVGTLMSEITYPKTPITLLPRERQNLLELYGP